jgi:hypothetical protein
MNERERRLPCQVYWPRIFGRARGFLCIAAVFDERGASAGGAMCVLERPVAAAAQIA